MNNPPQKNSISKSRGVLLVEKALFALCLCVILGRLFLLEGTGAPSGTLLLVSGGSSVSVTLSVVLIFAFIFWFLRSCFAETLVYRKTRIEPGIILFALAAVIAIFAASNKRAAINNSLILIAPMLVALLFIQIADTRKKIRIILYTVAIIGAVAAVYSAMQFFWINEKLIEQYQQNPEQLLNRLGIAAGSFNHMLFEHSLESRDVRNFFTTGNSAASLAVLCSFAASGLLMEKLTNRRHSKKASGRHKSISWTILPVSVLLGLNLFGLFITRSKGGIGALGVVALALFAYLGLGNWLKTHKKIIVGAVAAFAIAAIISVAFYGKDAENIPGGNSMLVRLQYWSGAVRMYADHPLAGVGGDNFAYYFTRYKTPSALESVSDPHNFALALLCEYGPLGLLGFLAAIILPFLHRIKSSGPSPQANSPDRSLGPLYPALIAAISAVLLHNLVDFAIFEPVILTVFWTVVACAVAMRCDIRDAEPAAFCPRWALRITAVLLTAVIAYLCFTFALNPVSESQELIDRAMKTHTSSHILLGQAARIDPFDPVPCRLNGKLYLRRFEHSSDGNSLKLENAASAFRRAIRRNPADYKNYARLAEIYKSLAQMHPDSSKQTYRHKAFQFSHKALRRYPGSGKLHFTHARLAEELGKKQTALKHYARAVEIENSYREQFRRMYPARPIFSRLGEEKYQQAQYRIQQLRAAH